MKTAIIFAVFISIGSIGIITATPSAEKGQMLPDPECFGVLCRVVSEDECEEGQIVGVPNGECCPRCVFQSDCACVPIVCEEGQTQYTIPGACCPICVTYDLDQCPLKCPPGTRCEFYKPTGEAFCTPDCSMDNGGCAKDKECTLVEVHCTRPPCPPVVKCL